MTTKGGKTQPRTRRARADGATAVQRVLNELTEGFRIGRYAPGQRLVAGDCAAQLMMSRAPVREAFHVLAGQGLLVLEPNHSVRIRHCEPRHLVDMLRVLKATSSLGIELAAPRIAADTELRGVFAGEVERLRAVAARRRPFDWFTALEEFHNRIDGIANNEFLSSAIAGMHLAFFNRAMAERLPGPHWDEYARNYEWIASAVATGDVATATSRFNFHMDWVISLLRSSQSIDNGK